MSTLLCAEPSIIYNGKNIKTQEELNIYNIQQFLTLYYSGRYIKDGCGPGDIYIKTLDYNENNKFKNRLVIIDSSTIIIIKNDLLITITNLSFITKKFDLTYVKLNTNMKKYYFAINYWKDNDNVYNFDLIITISVSDIIYKINRLSAKSINGTPQIRIQNNNICMIYNNKILIQKPIMDFFYYSFFGENNNIYQLNKYLPIRVEMPKLNIFSDIYFDTNNINLINQEEINIDFIIKNSNLSYNAKIYEDVFTNNINSFVSIPNIVLTVPIDNSLDCTLNPDFISRSDTLKYAIIAGTIGCIIIVIIFVLLILEKRKHQCEVLYSY